MSALHDIAARAESAGADETRELLEEAWEVLNGPAIGVAGEDPRWPHWVAFSDMLDAGAYLDAALMLLPEGWKLRQMSFSAPCADDRKWHLNLHGGTVGQDTFVGRGKTPALALLAAICRAHAGGEQPDIIDIMEWRT